MCKIYTILKGQFMNLRFTFNKVKKSNKATTIQQIDQNIFQLFFFEQIFNLIKNY